MSTTTKPRLHHFDMLKGVAIFLVVMGHVITMCIREVDSTPLFKFLERIHMPLFFFVSGWFTYKLSAEGRIVLPPLGQRALRLLLPMVVTSSLWIWYFPHSGLQSPITATFSALWADSFKNGYWFTLVLFELIVIYVPVAMLLQRCRSALASVSVVAAAWAILLVLNAYVVPANIGNYISLNSIVQFFPIYLFGVLARRYRDGFNSLVHNTWTATVAIPVFMVAMYMLSWPWEIGLQGIPMMLVYAVLYISLCLIIYPLFEAWGNRAFSPDATPVSNRIARIWEYLGTQSLGIYLLHYFFLFPMGDLIRPTLVSLNLSLVPMTLVAAFTAACIILVVLFVIKVISLSRLWGIVLIGNK